MKSFQKKYWELLVAVILVGVIVLSIRSFQNNLCSNSDYQNIFSPNQTKATLYIRDCGATTDYVTNIEIDGKKIFVANGYYKDKINMKWESDYKFIIEYSGKKDDVYSYSSVYRNINIDLVQK